MNHLIKLEDCTEFIAGDKTLLREILHPDKHGVQSKYSLAWFKVLPNQKTTKHSLKTSEVYFIISGTGKMHINDKKFDVGTNDTIYIPPNSVQFIENLSKKEEIVALCIVDPAWRKENEEIYE